MVEIIIKAAILVVVLVVVGFIVIWALAQVGIVVPQIVIMGVVAIVVLLGLLWLWQKRGSLFKL